MNAIQNAQKGRDKESIDYYNAQMDKGVFGMMQRTAGQISTLGKRMEAIEKGERDASLSGIGDIKVQRRQARDKLEGLRRAAAGRAMKRYRQHVRRQKEKGTWH